MKVRNLALVLACCAACSSTESTGSGSSSGSSGSGSSGGSSSADASTESAGGDSGASTSSTQTASDGGSSSASNTATQDASTGGSTDAGRVATAPPPPPAPPRNRIGTPPPRYTEVEAHLQQAAHGRECFVHNVINADVSSAFVDNDFDGDGLLDRVFQLPDCIAVITQGTTGWEFSFLMPRSIPQDFDSVRVDSVMANGARLVEIRYSRDEPRMHEVHRFRWNGHDLIQLQ